MQINKATLTFEVTTREEADILYEMAEECIFRGKIPTGPLTEQWYKAGGFADYQRLLVMSTVLPQRMLFSAACYYRQNSRHSRHERLDFDAVNHTIVRRE